MNELAQQIDVAARELINDIRSIKKIPRLEKELIYGWNHGPHYSKISKKMAFTYQNYETEAIQAAIQYAFDQDLQTGTQVLFALKERYQDIYPEAFKNYE